MTSWNICDVFPRNMTYILQNMQFSQYFTVKFNIFSLNLTGGPIFLFYLLVCTGNFLWEVFNKIWMIRFFAVVNYMVRKFSFCSTLYADVIANIILLHIFINLKIYSLYFMKHDPEVKSFIQIVTFLCIYARLQTGRIMVWWCPSVRVSVRFSVRPGLRPPVFRTFLLHTFTYSAEILHMTFIYCTTDQVRVSSLCVNFSRSYASLWT